jgi:S1-C subfamily serine protease
MPIGALLAAGVGVGLFVVGTFVVAGWLTTEREGDAASTRTIHDVVYLSSSTTASTALDTAQPGWLGISAVDQPGAPGVTVTETDPGSPAERALRPRDVIVSVDGTATPTMAELVVVLAATRPGHHAAIRLVRNRATLTVPVVLGRQP